MLATEPRRKDIRSWNKLEGERPDFPLRSDSSRGAPALLMACSEFVSMLLLDPCRSVPARRRWDFGRVLLAMSLHRLPLLRASHLPAVDLRPAPVASVSDLHRPRKV